ncbi:hypothetical protein [Bradyrhizobium lablabi]|uniref:hypothetical protein n=1 Tax=Bradyrhizobium lablabi TaxID=722472 RepID=UPI00090997FC|nr:hypothetical protein [Bradyrhizobium lablabi]SHK61491.1 hypothetical protein SAMN05444321_0053 [Bradyrhizobium lablabi]
MENERLSYGQSRAEKMRAAHYKWVGMPPGLTPELASKFMLGLYGGKTITNMTSAGEHYICSFDRFNKHCELNPQWGSEARKASRASFIAKEKASNPKKRATQIMCLKGLHAMMPDNVMMHKGRRNCLTCWRHAFKNPPTHTILPVLDQIKEKLSRGVSLGEITNGKVTGGGKVDRSLVLVRSNVLYRYRELNPDFDEFVRRATSKSSSRGQRIRQTRVRTAARRNSNNDYQAIRSLIPAGNPHRDDIVARIFEDLLGGTLKREEVPARVKGYIAELNRLYPTKYVKFGDATLVSLDEVLFDDGSMTRGDTVTCGLWD